MTKRIQSARRVHCIQCGPLTAFLPTQAIQLRCRQVQNPVHHTTAMPFLQGDSLQPHQESTSLPCGACHHQRQCPLQPPSAMLCSCINTPPLPVTALVTVANRALRCHYQRKATWPQHTGSNGYGARRRCTQRPPSPPQARGAASPPAPADPVGSPSPRCATPC